MAKSVNTRGVNGLNVEESVTYPDSNMRDNLHYNGNSKKRKDASCKKEGSSLSRRIKPLKQKKKKSSTNKLKKVLKHSQVKMFCKCNECGKCFSCSKYLKQHEKTHTGGKPYKCSLCEKSFCQSTGLKTHYLKHYGQRPFKCQFCEKGFTQAYNLRQHQKVHTGYRPHICEFCSKAFTQISNYKQHLKIHTNAKDFQCDQCGMRFNQNLYLIRHLNKHTGKRPFKCNECSKSFTQLTNLKTHCRTHTGVKPFLCNTCGKEFTTKSNLKQHFKKCCPSVKFGANNETKISKNALKLPKTSTMAHCLNASTLGSVNIDTCILKRTSENEQVWENREQQITKNSLDMCQGNSEIVNVLNLADGKVSKKQNYICKQTENEINGFKGMPVIQQTNPTLHHDDGRLDNFKLEKVDNCLRDTHIDKVISDSDFDGELPKNLYAEIKGQNNSISNEFTVVEKVHKFQPYDILIEQPKSPKDNNINKTRTLKENETFIQSEKRTNLHDIQVQREGTRLEQHSESVNGNSENDDQEISLDSPLNKIELSDTNSFYSEYVTAVGESNTCSSFNDASKVNSEEHEKKELTLNAGISNLKESEIHELLMPDVKGNNFDLLKHNDVETVGLINNMSEDKETIKNNAHKCQECGKCFSLKKYLNQHKKTHLGVKPFKCDICEKCYSQRTAMKFHMQTHSGKKLHSCNICHKSFTQPGNLVQHQQIHTAETLHVCQHCRKSFTQKQNLKQHLKIHDNQRAYTCEQCGKSFNQMIYLQRHYVQHTGERPFACSLCKKSFTQLTNLNHHLRTHTGEKPYQCYECGKCFTTNSNLKQHLRKPCYNNQRNMSVNCSKCGKMFSGIGYLKQHFKKSGCLVKMDTFMGEKACDKIVMIHKISN